MSRKLICSLVAVAIVLPAAIAIPDLLSARFTSSGYPISGSLRVLAPPELE